MRPTNVSIAMLWLSAKANGIEIQGIDERIMSRALLEYIYSIEGEEGLLVEQQGEIIKMINDAMSDSLRRPTPRAVDAATGAQAEGVSDAPPRH